MSTKPDLRVVHTCKYGFSPNHPTHTKDCGVGSDRPASTADLVAALIAEGGEIEEAFVSDGYTRVDTSGLGPHLVFRIPVESAEAKETP